MNDVSSLRDTIVPKSDQLNAEQLIGAPITVTITAVKRGDSDEQPVTIAYEGDNGRPYKPCKTMRKVLIFAWGDDGREWAGKSMTLYCDPEVKFGGVKVGGVRISHLSHIERDLDLALTATRGRKETVRIRKIMDAPVASNPPAEPDSAWADPFGDAIAEAPTLADLKDAFDAATSAARERKDSAAAKRFIALKDVRKGELMAGEPE